MDAACADATCSVRDESGAVTTYATCALSSASSATLLGDEADDATGEDTSARSSSLPDVCTRDSSGAADAMPRVYAPCTLTRTLHGAALAEQF